MRHILIALGTALALAACTESPQKLPSSSRDSAAYTGTGSNFVNKDWKPGDKAAWEAQLKARGQLGMNDYARIQ